MKRHKKFNIEYDEITPEKLTNLTIEQAKAMAEYINKIVREREEALYIISMTEMGCLPDELKIEWPKEDDYITIGD